MTVTGYKYLNIGINVKLPSYVTIILGDCHGKEIPLSPDIWRELLEQKHVILSLLQYDENNKGIRAPSPIYVGNLTLRYGRINNLPILRLETSTIGRLFIRPKRNVRFPTYIGDGARIPLLFSSYCKRDKITFLFKKLSLDVQ